MRRLFFLTVFCGVSASGCVPAPVLRSPAVNGTVTNAKTGRPVAGALVFINTNSLGIFPAGSFPQARSDANGRFSLSATHRFGFVGFVGDPPLYEAMVRITKPGYRDYAVTQPCPRFEPVLMDAKLVRGYGADIAQEPLLPNFLTQ